MKNRHNNKTIDIDIHFKEKNCSPDDYNAVALAWLESQKVFKNSLKILEDKNLLSHGIAWKLYREFKTSDLDYKLRKLKLIYSKKALNGNDYQLSSQIPQGKTILPSYTKKALKEKIIYLAKNQDLPNFSYDSLIKTTSDLLNHPDLTNEERSRYAVYYSELIEYRNYKIAEREERNPEQAQFNVSSQSTSISQIRKQMTQQLNKLREVYQNSNLS